MMKKIVGEPLLHFILISVLFFVVYNMMNPRQSGGETIYVSEGRVAQIKNSFVAQWKRQPLPKELDDAIHSFAVNEMYLLEAKSLQLNVGDKVIDRRLRQKMKYLLDDLAASKEPTEDELRQFYQSNTDRYRSAARYGFKQIFISGDRDEVELQSLVALQQQRIQQGLSPEGEPSLLPAEVTLESQILLERKFGANFSSELEALDIDQWSGPIESAFGLHYVFLMTRKTADVKPFEKVRRSVLDDWQYQNIKAYQKPMSRAYWTSTRSK